MSEQSDLEAFQSGPSETGNKDNRSKMNWEERTLSDVIDINDYPSLEKGEEHTYVGMKYLDRHIRKIQGYEQKEYKYSSPRFKNGDTLFARITPCLENGKTAFVDILDDDEAAFGSTEFIVMSATEETIPKFVYYTAKRPDVRQYAIKRMTGTSGRQRVPTDVFDNFKIQLPPVEEQEKIVAFLDALDTKIETNERICEILKEIGKTLFESWFVDFEPYNEFKKSQQGEIPEEFNVESLADIAEVTYGYSFDSDKFNEEGKGTPVIRNGDLPAETIDYSTNKYIQEEFDSDYEVWPGDLIVTMDRYFDPYIWRGEKAALNQRICRFEGISEEYSNIFLYYLMQDPINKIERAKTGTTLPHLSKTDIGNIEVVIPDKKSLEKFNAKVQPMYEKIVESSKENRHLADLRDTILPELMSGEIRLDPDTDNASMTND